MGKFGFHSGYVKAQNLQAGSATVTVDGNGDGTQAVTFKRKFKNAPVIMLTAQAADDTVTVNPTSVTTSGFTIHADGSQTTSGTVSVGYIALDDPATGFA